MIICKTIFQIEFINGFTYSDLQNDINKLRNEGIKNKDIVIKLRQSQLHVFCTEIRSYDFSDCRPESFMGIKVIVE